MADAFTTAQEAGRFCRTCEYFDAQYGDCHNPNSDRFQTQADSTCLSWVQTSSQSVVRDAD